MDQNCEPCCSCGSITVPTVTKERSALFNSLTWDQVRYLLYADDGNTRYGYPSCTAKELRDLRAKGFLTADNQLTDFARSYQR